MPWNTSKTDVDEDSEIWAQARRHIVDALRKSVSVMNRVKREVQQLPPDDRPLVERDRASYRPRRWSTCPNDAIFHLPRPGAEACV